jgi:hypothetical protein
MGTMKQTEEHNYSQHPKSRLSGFNEFDSRPDAKWSGFRIPFENRMNSSGFQIIIIYNGYICLVFEW